MVHIINEKESVCNQFLAQLRDVEKHTDRLRFRRNLQRVGEVMAYEISQTFSYRTAVVQTPISRAEIMLPEQEVVIASVLRAGLPFHQGFLNYFDEAGNAFISARRVYDEKQGFSIRYDSVYTPVLDGKQLLLVDPMLATGASMKIAYEELIRQGGRPAHTHIAAVLASPEGLAFLKKSFAGEAVSIWIGALDKGLTEKSYIDPGLGDAGDLAFGEKI